MNIVQFTPYFPPHIGGVEKVVYDIHKNWNYGKSVVVTSDIGQDSTPAEMGIIGYPVFEFIKNFPIPKIWSEALRKFFSELPEKDTVVISHTRFFLSSFLAGRYAKKYNLKWVHIEHGSGYVKSGSKIVDVCSKIYDKTLGKYCIKNADIVLGISQASCDFIKNEFGREDVQAWYRGIDFPIKNIEAKKGNICFVFIGRLTALKNVASLIKIYINGTFQNRLYIIGDGEEKNNLKQQSRGVNIEFLGSLDHEKIIDFLGKNKCILVNPSSQEGMPTTVIEGLVTNNLVIATNVGGTNEISDKEDLLLYEFDDDKKLESLMYQALEEYDTYAGKSYKTMKDKFSQEKSIESLYNYMQ